MLNRSVPKKIVSPAKFSLTNLFVNVILYQLFHRHYYIEYIFKKNSQIFSSVNSSRKPAQKEDNKQQKLYLLWIYSVVSNELYLLSIFKSIITSSGMLCWLVLNFVKKESELRTEGLCCDLLVLEMRTPGPEELVVDT